jgi:CAAX prenyl protease-like protein
MSDTPELKRAFGEPAWVARLANRRPDFALMAPFMVYLALLPLNDWVPKSYMPIAIALRGIAGLAVFWMLRRHMPPLGKPHLLVGIVGGIFAAALWVGGEHLFDGITIAGWNLGGRLPIMPGQAEVVDPRADISTLSWWSQAVLRITVASTTVPVVEEIFWRAFLLRALIDWDHFERVPLGKFTLFSFLVTSLLSTLQHPDNWAISIFCWFFYNGLMYWKKSVLCLMIAHGVTNLVLYVYVIAYEDWMFW